MAGYTGGDARPTSADEAERAWLQSTVAPPCGASRSSLRVVDLFSGCGGLSIGLAEAARALNRSFEPVLAVDVDQVAAETYAANFPTAATVCKDVTEVLPGKVGARLTSAERMLSKHHAEIDVLVGGPPCQGHSDFNNRTRHADDKNELYRTMVRAAEVLEPQHILIENVPGALNDRRSVVQRTADALGELGYHVSIGVMNLHDIGVPQRRRRLALMASLTHAHHARRGGRAAPTRAAHRGVGVPGSRGAARLAARRASSTPSRGRRRRPASASTTSSRPVGSTCPTASARRATPTAATATRPSTAGWRGTGRRRPSPRASTACAWAATCIRASGAPSPRTRPHGCSTSRTGSRSTRCGTARRWPG